ncbi:MAG: cytidine deaminase [Eubacterium sp.]|nr:cytidine deaminase [Eubacterium sp.]
MDDTVRQLAGEALQARERSYSPYSRFAVGAALLAEDGRIFTGCNIENAAFSPTICAERTAIFNAVSEGVRSFRAIAIAGGPAGEPAAEYCPPCGVCRQVMREFCDDDFPILLVVASGSPRIITLGSLLPDSFGPDLVKGRK